MAGLRGPDAASRLAPEHHDAAIGGADVLQSVDGDRPLRDLRLVVAGLSLTGLVGFPASWAGAMMVLWPTTRALRSRFH